MPLAQQWCIFGLWLLQDINRKPHTGSQDHWSACHGQTVTRSDQNDNASVAFTMVAQHQYGPHQTAIGGAYHFAT